MLSVQPFITYEAHVPDTLRLHTTEPYSHGLVLLMMLSKREDCLAVPHWNVPVPVLGGGSVRTAWC